MQISRAAAAFGNASSVPSYEPFCSDAEGWGPLSLIRYDFTPCFVDVPVASVSLFGILFGAYAIWKLLTERSKQPTEKDWHYFTKLVCWLSQFE
jgi:ATP-binding cassette subfamily C (CFTR/MRP) protein 1